MKKVWLAIFTASLFLVQIFPAQTEILDLEKLYLDAKFSLIAEYFQERNYEELSLQDKLLFIECLARTAQGSSAMDKMKLILAECPVSCEVLTTAGVVSFSNGRFGDAEKYIEKALTLEAGFNKAILAKVMYLIYCQHFSEAENWYEKLIKRYPEWRATNLVYLVGLELYGAKRNPRKISSLYHEQAKKFKQTDKRQYRDLIDNSKLFKKIPIQKSFSVGASSDKVILPFEGRVQDSRFITVSLLIKNKKFRIILDTGNTAGWMIHNRGLKGLLKSKSGGRIKAQIGREAGMLDGYRIYTGKIDLGGLQINHLTGLYVPKPHPSYPDANLNPVFIKDWVVTIDFIKEQVIFRSKERFDMDFESLVSQHSESIRILPWFGYEQAYIPVIVNDQWKSLAMIETGAEDIALRLGFARQLPLVLKPKLKYLASGKEVRYSTTPVTISAGRLRFDRETAEVWPLMRFYDRITGLNADVIIGPLALSGRIVCSFDPFDRKIILSGNSF